MTAVFKISGMVCEACSQLVHQSLLKVPGIKTLQVDFSQACARVELEEAIGIDLLQSALADTPYEIHEGTLSTNGAHVPSPADVTAKNKALITSYITAAGQLDDASLSMYLHPGFRYTGPINYESPAEFIAMIKQHAKSTVADVLLKYQIQALFVDENEACAIYEGVFRVPGSDAHSKVAFMEHITIEDDKILSTHMKHNRHEMKEMMRGMSHQNE